MKPGTGLWFLLFVSLCFTVKSKCSKGCELALASYYVWPESNLTFIGQVLGSDPDTIVSYNKEKVPDKDRVQAFIRVNVPFSCDCIRGEFLGHEFLYNVSRGNTYELIAETYYANLTTIEALTHFNSYDPNNVPDTAQLNVTVNCSCGNSDISKDYGLFITFPIREEDSLLSIAANESIDAQLLQRYNEGVDFGRGSGFAFVPGKDASSSYRPLNASSGLAGGVIAGIVVAAIAVLILAGGIYIYFFRKKKADTKLLPAYEDQSSHDGRGITGITIDKSVEFSYEELAQATNDFNLASKIGQGGFGAVYYAELRGEKAAIKKMDMQASKEFLAELRVLTRVHHLNLVRLIGYCVEGSLFLVYEYIENGNLSEHLRGSGREPLPWSTRVQIALDSARGLEYIHEHTVPVYIHRDIKSANILIDKNFHGKVADFGLTKLTEVGSTSLQTRLVGTFGYMPPEYAQYGDVSPKVDVYAFGVVVYELISSKEAVVKGSSLAESKGLVALFEDVLNQPDPREDLCKLVDPRLGDNYPIDAVRKMAQLAKACTHENPQLRPSMRSIVVALMTLSSSTEDWDIGSFYDNQVLVNLMSGR
uniref:non-specific serine/threonine protein kinase n=1 Tax=Ceanothus thyrsiflorus TaxID=48245 RepID=A0A3S5HLS5_CEATH|nr:LysM receptor kinase [Ceanothus thyrsiflorus]